MAKIPSPATGLSLEPSRKRHGRSELFVSFFTFLLTCLCCFASLVCFKASVFLCLCFLWWSVVFFVPFL